MSLATTKDVDVTKDELFELLAKRSSTYALLSRLYLKEVDEQLLGELRATYFPADTGNEKIDEGYIRLVSYLNNASDNTLTELAVDYTRTFMGQGMDAYSAAYPFESVYTSEKRLVMQKARDEVRALYFSEGLKKQESWREGEDHIALELDFINVLGMRAREALETGNDEMALNNFVAQNMFLENHVLNWVFKLTRDIRRFAKTDFYFGLSLVTEGYLKEDQEFLQTLLQESSDD